MPLNIADSLNQHLQIGILNSYTILDAVTQWESLCRTATQGVTEAGTGVCWSVGDLEAIQNCLYNNSRIYKCFIICITNLLKLST